MARQHLTHLAVRNFQVHERLDCELDPGITTFVGRTDAGKSAILRALRWVMENSTRGFDFLRWGAKRCAVAVTIGGQKVVRRRSDKENSYLLDDVKFDAVAGAVPSVIDDLLQVSAVNFQGQFESPFWLAESSGEIARQLNQCVNLEEIDRCLAAVASLVRKTGIEVELAREQYLTAQSRLDSLEYVDECARDFEVMDALAEDYQVLLQTRSRLRQTVLKVEFSESEMATWSAACDSIQVVVVKAKSWRDCVRRYRELEGAVEAAIVAQRAQDVPIPDLSGLEKIGRLLTTKKTVILATRLGIGRAEEEQENYRESAKMVAFLEKKLQDDMGDTCALCGQGL